MLLFLVLVGNSALFRFLRRSYSSRPFLIALGEYKRSINPLDSFKVQQSYNNLAAYIVVLGSPNPNPTNPNPNPNQS